LVVARRKRKAAILAGLDGHLGFGGSGALRGQPGASDPAGGRSGRIDVAADIIGLDYEFFASFCALAGFFPLAPNLRWNNLTGNKSTVDCLGLGHAIK